jgi:Sec-independent protein secretion pathway component TatC
MNAMKLPFGIFAFLGFVVVIPFWLTAINEFTAGMTTTNAWLARLSLPAALMLFLASWMQPRGGTA